MTFSSLSFEQMHLLAEGSYTHPVEQDECAQGILFTVPLGNTPQPHAVAVFPLYKEVTIAGLPLLGDEKEVARTVAALRYRIEPSDLSTIVVDRLPSSTLSGITFNDLLKQTPTASLFVSAHGGKLEEGIQRFIRMIDALQADKEKRLRFLEAGKQLLERVRPQADRYCIREYLWGGLLEKETSLGDFLRFFPEHFSTERDELIHYLILLYCFDLCCQAKVNLTLPLKNSCVTAIIAMKEDLEQVRFCAKYLRDHLPQTEEEMEEAEEQAERLAQEAKATGGKQEITIEELFPSTQDEQAAETIEESIARLVEQMQQVSTEEGACRYLQKLKQIKEASAAGKLAHLHHLLPKRTLSQEQIEATALHIARTIQEHRSALYLLPHTTFLGEGNLIQQLVQRGIAPQQHLRSPVKGIAYRILQDNQEVGFLLGTLHYTDLEAAGWTSSIHHALRSARVIYLEVEPTEEKQERQPQEAFTLSSTQQERLTHFMEAATKKLLCMLKEQGISQQKMQEIEASLAEALPVEKRYQEFLKTLSELSQKTAQTVSVELFGSSIPLSFEALILAIAKRDEKPIRGLESLESATSALKALHESSIEAVDSLPVDSLEVHRYLERKKEQQRQIYQAWKEGNTRYFHQQCHDERLQLPHMYQAVYGERNARFSAAIERALQVKEEHPAFFGVGVNHLHDEEGVVDRLQKAGYRLQRL